VALAADQVAAQSALVAAEESAEALKDTAAANARRAYEIAATDAQKLLADAKALAEAVWNTAVADAKLAYVSCKADRIVPDLRGAGARGGARRRELDQLDLF
jgi:cell division septum initiation protein DivIVA